MIKIYTDGACSGNPGPGGYGIVLFFGEEKKEISGGFRKTTNNRMELFAAKESLKILKEKSEVILFSDSKYLVEAMEKRWPHRWRLNNWKLNHNKYAENRDLWQELLQLTEEHEVTFKWVKGHSDNPNNNRCDELAVAAAKLEELPPDSFYEKKVEQKNVQMTLF